MKEDYDDLVVIDRNEYVKLFQFLKIKNYKKGEVIKSHEEHEIVSRYIFSGDIAEYEYRDSKLYCRKIFSAQETACDFESYWSEEKSDITLKAFTDVQVGELNRADEFKVIEHIPVFAKWICNKKLNKILSYQFLI
jgi:signal-transduction protein with cAMP-binding, CBS, and nucleotidyltransferase domain